MCPASMSRSEDLQISGDGLASQEYKTPTYSRAKHCGLQRKGTCEAGSPGLAMHKARHALAANDPRSIAREGGVRLECQWVSPNVSDGVPTDLRHPTSD